MLKPVIYITTQPIGQVLNDLHIYALCSRESKKVLVF